MDQQKTREGGKDRETKQQWLEHPVFGAAGDAVCQRLAERYPATRHTPGATVASPEDDADRLYVLLRGTLRAFVSTPDGREATTRLCRAPNLFGDAELLQGIPLLAGAAAVDEVELATIPAAEYLQLLAEYPAMMQEQLRGLAATSCLATRNQRTVFVTLEHRVANLLLTYADCFGEPCEEGVVLRTPLTQTEIAHSLGTVWRSVARVMSPWIKAGVVAKRGQHLVISQPERLEALAASIRGGLCHQLGQPIGELAREAAAVQAEIEVLVAPGSQQGRRLTVEQEVLVGRRAPCDLRICDDYVSDVHCRIFRGATGGRYWLEDLGSLNGTAVNGKQITHRTVLRDGDVIKVGAIRLGFRLPGAGAAAEPAAA